MKRQLLVVIVGSLFALPAMADFESGLNINEIQPGVSLPIHSATKTRGAVHSELLDAQRAGQTVVDSEAGRTAKQYADMLPESMATHKTRDEVRAETLEARRSGDFVINSELGTKARHL